MQLKRQGCRLFINLCTNDGRIGEGFEANQAELDLVEHVAGLVLALPVEVPEPRLDRPYRLPLRGVLVLPPPPSLGPPPPPNLGLERLPYRRQVQARPPDPRGGGGGGGVVGLAEAREQVGLRDRRAEEGLELPGPRADEAQVLPQAPGEEGERTLPRRGGARVDAEASHVARLRPVCRVLLVVVVVAEAEAVV